MNIAFIGAFTGIGGIQRVAALVASELSQIHTVTFIDYRGDDTFYFPVRHTIKVRQVASAQNRGKRMSPGDKIHKMYQPEIAAIKKIMHHENTQVAIF